MNELSNVKILDWHARWKPSIKIYGIIIEIGIIGRLLLVQKLEPKFVFLPSATGFSGEAVADMSSEGVKRKRRRMTMDKIRKLPRKAQQIIARLVSNDSKKNLRIHSSTAVKFV